MTDWAGSGSAISTEAGTAGQLTTIAKIQALHDIDPSWTSAQITVAINAASEAISRYCDRTFEATSYRLWMDGSGGQYLSLREYPIISLYRVAVNCDQAISLTNSSASMTWASAVVENGSLLLTVVGGANDGTSTVSLYTVATAKEIYNSMAELVTAIEALNKGWDAAVILEGQPAAIRPGFSASDPGTGVLYLYQPGDDCTGYVPRLAEGMLHRPSGWPKEPGSVHVYYQGGYSTIPADLEMVCNMLAVDMLRTGTDDSRVTQERIGNIAFTYQASSGGLIANYKTALNPYKRRDL